MKLNRLNAIQVKNAGPGRHPDGGGLALLVGTSGSRSWVFRYRRPGGAGETSIGFGSADVVGLKDAREKAGEARAALARGDDPQAMRTREAPKATPTFKEVARDYLTAMTPSWRNAKHAAQWGTTLETYAYPTIGDRPVDAITAEDMLTILSPIWSTKPETATRVRGRVEAVLDAASARGLRSGDNPARWKGAMARLLPPRSRVATVKHHAAAAAADVPTIVKVMTATRGSAPLALRFTILTAARTGETIGAKWGEMDLKAKVWTVPGERMKAGRPHRVPLSAPALAVLAAAAEMRLSDDPAAPVFPSRGGAGHLSNMALAMMLRKKGFAGLTVHGFRSTFRDWCAERGEDWTAAEMSLAHTVGDGVVRAYLRSDLLDQRRALMTRWGAFSTGTKVKKGAAADGE
ncbi:integrase arm-type DNA-binding domain-containing protein [Roseomonas terrae]|uniref:Integrase arm-type DNA-binding domain-containing protein n=1 Tax=Neoroseomonas terrae TaxID=424799 RepID=A0ABS5EKQ6_9PROT|nr:integrase arm-type DNA-binding domain-containing protein [Neoroseomonas terrae]MBR0651617.1 integrase arm-type DNA-binding domain-containing protein [Neoroseomonas terrae]